MDSWEIAFKRLLNAYFILCSLFTRASPLYIYIDRAHHLGMNADASALWAGNTLQGAAPMRLRETKFVAEAPGKGMGWAQADRPLSQGDRFLAAGRRARESSLYV